MDKHISLEKFIFKVQEAKYEAIKRGILANAVAINKDFCLFTHPISGIQMIGGLKTIFTEELPANTAFAVLELSQATSDTPTADVVEVVRCEDCAYRRVAQRCSLWMGTTGDTEYFREHGDDFYCAFGTPKGTGGD